LFKKTAPTKQPDWRNPQKPAKDLNNSDTLNQTHSQSVPSSAAHGCVESFRVSDIFTIVCTPNDEYYGEFHGTELPDEVVIGDAGIYWSFFG